MSRVRLAPSVLLALCVGLAAPTAAQAEAPTPPVATLDLDQAVTRFREESPTMAILAGRVAEAQATVKLATAATLPVLAAQGGYTRNSDQAVISIGTILQNIADSLPAQITLDPSLLPPDFIMQPQDQFTAGASLQVPLIQPQAWADVGAAKAGRDAVEATAESRRLQAESGLVKACWLAQAAQEKVDVTARGVTTAKAHEASTRRRLDAGIGTQLDVLQAQVELARRKSDQVSAVADLDKARGAIGALLGIQGPVDVKLPALDADPAPEEGVPDDHPDLVAAHAAWQATQRQVASAWWRQAPTLSGSATVFGSDVQYVTGKKDGWKLSLNLTWVLFDGGARYGLLDKARAQRVQAEAQEQQARLNLDRDARDAERSLQAARELLALAQEGSKTAAEAEATATRLYDAGLLNSLDLIDAQQRHIEADLGLAGVHAQLAAARSDLAVAHGRSWEGP